MQDSTVQSTIEHNEPLQPKNITYKVEHGC